MDAKITFSWRGFMLLTVALAQNISAQTNYYWQTIGTSVGSSGGPWGVAVDQSGDVFFVDNNDNTIFKAAQTGTNWSVSLIAGQVGMQGTNDGIGSVAAFSQPNSIALQDSNTLFVTDSGNNAIREIHFNGVNWTVTTIAGMAGNGSRDGTNQVAQFSYPNGIAIDWQGNLYVADFANATIRKIQHLGTNWITTTIAGTPENSNWMDGTNNSALFSAPQGITVNSGGTLFVADAGGSGCNIRQIKSIGTNWVTTTIAGPVGAQAGNNGFADGTNFDAQFNPPFTIAVDSLNNLYVADYNNNSIRKIYPVGTNWITTTIGGDGGDAGLQDGTNIVALFYNPFGVAVDSGGNVYIGDTGNNALRIGYLFPPMLQFTAVGSQMTFSYPFALGTNFNFILQNSTNLSHPVWVNLTNQWLFDSNQTPFINLNITNQIPMSYFRLQLP